MTSDKYSLKVILENMNGKLDILLEMLTQTRQEMATKEELAEVKADVKVIKAVVTEHSG